MIGKGTVNLMHPDMKYNGMCFGQWSLKHSYTYNTYTCTFRCSVLYTCMYVCMYVLEKGIY